MSLSSQNPKQALVTIQAAMVGAAQMLVKALKIDDLEAIQDHINNFINQVNKYNEAISKLNAKAGLTGVTDFSHIEKNKAFFEKLPQSLIDKTHQYLEANEKTRHELKENIIKDVQAARDKVSTHTQEDQPKRSNRPGS